MTQVKADAQYLFAHYKESGRNLAELLYQRIVKTQQLTAWEAKALADEFKKLVKKDKTQGERA